MTTGITLRVARVRARLRQIDVSTALSCSRSRIGQIESLTAVSPDWARRYRHALDTATRTRLQTQETAAPGYQSGAAKEAGDAAPKPLR